MSEPRLCYKDCEYISPTEEEQDRAKAEGLGYDNHICEKYDRPLTHGVYHPRLVRCEECTYERIKPYDHTAKAIHDALGITQTKYNVCIEKLGDIVLGEITKRRIKKVINRTEVTEIVEKELRADDDLFRVAVDKLVSNILREAIVASQIVGHGGPEVKQ